MEGKTILIGAGLIGGLIWLGLKLKESDLSGVGCSSCGINGLTPQQAKFGSCAKRCRGSSDCVSICMR